jgi:hypothetical protein
MHERLGPNPAVAQGLMDVENLEKEPTISISFTYF